MRKSRAWKEIPPVYSAEDKTEIAGRVDGILARNPGIGDLEAQVYEVITRLRGDNGLSDHAARYLTRCIMGLLEERE
jgi:hypothetical protein